MIEVTKEPIRTEELVRAVSRSSSGAVLVFSGVVRDNARGRSTKFLEYEAYSQMARAEMQKIADETRRRWSIDEIAIVHRIGRLEIGEASVVIAVSAPHRGEAFDACEFAIDTLKTTVPIWKKEFTQDGSYWVEGPGECSLDHVAEDRSG